MNANKMTIVRFLIVAIFLGIFVWDAWLWLEWGWEYTISNMVSIWGDKWPLFKLIVPFFCGALCGHFFWPLRIKVYSSQVHTNSGS